jgi:hypothetical protein
MEANQLSPLEAISTQLATIMETMHAQQKMIYELQQAVAISKPPLPEAEITTTTEQLGKSEKIDGPPPFSGLKPSQLSSFIFLMKLKLSVNKDRYPTEGSQLAYMISRLTFRALDVLRPLVQTGSVTTVEQAYSTLEASFGDPNTMATAQAKLSTLKQRNSAFSQHFSTFRRYAADAQLNDSGLILALKNSLSTELKRAMVGVKVPASLNDYANLCATYDNDLRWLSKDSNNTQRSSKQRTSSPDTMDLDSASVKAAYAPKDSNERTKRIKEGRCFNCGKQGHISRDCPEPSTYRAPRSKSRGRTSQKTYARATKRSSSSASSSTISISRASSRSSYRSSTGKKSKRSKSRRSTLPGKGKSRV